MNRPPFDPFAVTLGGWQVVEASAGTGKTWAIAALFTRLIVETDLPPDHILIMTFTNAATAELRGRIRDRLLEARDGFARARRARTEAGESGEGAAPAEPFLAQLVARAEQVAGGVAVAERRLTNALRLFDEIPIYTIHGFCQRALTRAGLDAGWIGEVEVLTSEDELRFECAADFWRVESDRFSPGMVEWLVRESAGLGPAQLLRETRGVLGRPELRLLEPAVNTDPEEEKLEAGFREAFEGARTAWHGDPGGVAAQLRAKDRIDGSKFREAKREEKIALAELIFGADIPPHPVSIPKLRELGAAWLGQRLKKGKQPPDHPFFATIDPLIEAAERCLGSYGRQALELRLRFIRWMNTELVRRKRERRLRSFDDLLTGVQEALAAGGGGEFSRFVREHYHAALIDEFQDTDGRQFEILQQAFPTGGEEGPPVLLVGDPKQSIYAFRGADVFEYLKARDRAAIKWVLQENWRSAPDLIAAVNTLFDIREPFLSPAIGFSGAAPAARTRPDVKWGDSEFAPFELWALTGSSVTGARKLDLVANKRAAAVQAAQAVAREVALLLARGSRGEATIGGAGVGGRDIAILVRKHPEAKLMQRELRRLGVGSTRQSQDSVFASEEALHLERVLRAIAEPSDERRVRAALASLPLGWSALTIDGLSEADQRWGEIVELFENLRQRWERFGIARALRELMRPDGSGIAGADLGRLLAEQGGERALVNLNHLAELLEAEGLRRPGVDDLLGWFARQRDRATTDGAQAGEEEMLRLESEENLVRIVTCHVSKGLEYPIVYCPFLFAAGKDASSGVVRRFHDREQGNRPTVAIGGLSAPASGTAAGEADGPPHDFGWQVTLAVLREAIEEDLRILYVALTRARHRCVLVCGAVSDTWRTGLGWLLFEDQAERGEAKGFEERLREMSRLHGKRSGALKRWDKDDKSRSKKSPISPVEARAHGPGEDAHDYRVKSDGEVVPTAAHERFAALEQLVQRAAEAAPGRTPIRLVELPANGGPALASADAAAAASASAARVLRPCPTLPWGRLAQRRGVTSFTALRSGRVADLPDHDERVEPVALPAEGASNEIEFSFPAGARAGIALHGILEHFDVASPPADRLGLVERTLESGGLRLDETGRSRAPQVEAWMGRVLATELVPDSGLRLADVPPERRVAEIEFHLSARGVTLAGLNRVLERHGYPKLIGRAEEGLGTLLAEGWIKGIIDLVFEADGRHWILDWKSNHLGDTLEAYGPAEVDRVVRHEQYTLQYLTYGVALHRLLGQRLPDYDYEQHFGGVLYLFLRGLRPEHGARYGVHFDRPGREVIQDLDALIGGGGPGHV